MKILLDQGLPRTAAAILREHGIDAVHTGECGLATASDAEIIERAKQEQRVIVTLDSDFHAILVLARATAPSVIRIREEGLRAEATSVLVESVVVACQEDLAAGAVVTVHQGRIRARRLPVYHGKV
jgi:predicted nuclease of predicted toxin-antitoxin system